MAVTGRFLDRVSPWALSCTDSNAQFVLATNEPQAGEAPALQMSGVLEGPYCDLARTLTAQFPLTGKRNASNRRLATAHVTDPCYWTPSLPFLYRLSAEFAEVGEPAVHVDLMIGLRRWEIRGRSLGMDSKRVVLRGAAMPESNSEQLFAARGASATILVHDPPDAYCIEASRRGVALIADLRGVDRAINRLYRLAWHPSVLIALVDDDVWQATSPPGLMLARTFNAHSENPRHDDRGWARLCVVDLGADERPPAWAAEANFPLIAIRRGVAYADFHEARAACDRLQADLAPDVDLAGYFVAP